MMLIKSFFRRIIKDFRHKELLPLKLIFFVQASTLYVLYPYLTIHMRELGINVEETAIMSAVTPFVAIVMPPIAGMVADRIGNFKILLSIFSSLGGLAALLLLLVPIGRITVQLPDRVVMDLGCTGNGGEFIYTMNQNYPCHSKLKSEVATRIESCGYMCSAEMFNDSETDSILTSREYTVTHNNLETSLSSTFKYALSKQEIPPRTIQKEDMEENRKLRNHEYFKTSIRKLSENTYFFPTNQLYEFSCSITEHVRESEDDELTVSPIAGARENRTRCEFGHLIIPMEEGGSRSINYHSYKSKIKLDENSESNSHELRRYKLHEVAWSGKEFLSVSCQNPDEKPELLSVKIPLYDYNVSSDPYDTLNMENCSQRCIVTAPRADMCSNMNMVIEYNTSLTFWFYLAVRVFIGMIGGTAFAMFEGAVIAILREQKADYGLQRIYGSIGGMISSPLSGLLIQYASRNKGYTDFRPAFYLYAALKIFSGMLMLTINLEFKSPAKNVASNVLSVLKNVEVAALFIACFILGTAWGYIESFLFWLIQDLGGSSSLMGITITVGGIAGIPLLVLSGPIIAKIGHANVLFIGFVFYAIRLLGYSLIYNPWLTLIFEALESVTSSLSFTAAVTYAAKLSTQETDSSIQGLLGGLYYGVGKGSGSLIGGYLMKAFGTRPTYQIFAVVCLITGMIYYFFNIAYLKKRPQVEGNDIVKKKPKVVDQNGLENGMMELKDEKILGKSEKNNMIIETNGINNESFVSDKNDEKSENAPNFVSKSIEAIKNAKNLDQIKKLPHNDETTEKSRGKSDEESQPQNRKSGLSNLALEDDISKEGMCNVTIERPPDDKK